MTRPLPTSQRWRRYGPRNFEPITTAQAFDDAFLDALAHARAVARAALLADDRPDPLWRGRFALLSKLIDAVEWDVADDTTDNVLALWTQADRRRRDDA